MAIYTSMEQLIGGTPLLELAHLAAREGLKGTLLAKLEGFNPAGSAKDRVALAMIRDAEQRGLLPPAVPSSSPPPAIRASVWLPWLPAAVTGPSSSCRIP